MNIIVGCDHAGYELKQELITELKLLGYEIKDIGCYNSDENVDYPDYGFEVANSIANGQFKFGVLICGTGIGMSITANKVSGIRAALCKDQFTAEMARKHNDANILVIGARVTEVNTAKEIMKVFLTTKFEGGRHSKRLKKISIISGT